LTYETEKKRLILLSPGHYFHTLVDMHQAESQGLLSKLKEVEALTDKAAAALDTDLAEKAYIKVLKVHRGQPLQDRSNVTRLLKKIALFFKKTDQPVLAEEYWLEYLERDRLGQGHSADKEVTEVCQSLATSLPKTSGMISEDFQSRYPNLPPPLDAGTPFPPVHRIIISDYLSSTLHDSSGKAPSSDTTISSSFPKSLISGGKVAEIIQEMPDIDLGTRDILSRTALFLTALFKQEDAGHALITRIAVCLPEHRHQYVNARDPAGQTILGTAIENGCSLEFIRALIDNGAQIDPDTLAGPLTPLQAAALTGRQEVVVLLLDHGADINHVHPGNQTAAELAQDAGYHEIAHLINERSRSRLHEVSSPEKAPSEEDSGLHFASDLPSHPDATISDPLQNNAHNSPPWLYYNNNEE
jgi:Ankyrin repeats (3 copies)